MAENEVYRVPLREAFQVSSVASHAYTANLLGDYCYGSGEYNATLLYPDSQFRELHSHYSLLTDLVSQPFMEGIWLPCYFKPYPSTSKALCEI